MKMNENGSVLMEFIIVLPIYMLLLGFVFVIGDLSLDAIHLAGAADRTFAFSPTAFEEDYKLAMSPDRYAWEKKEEAVLSYLGDPDAGTARAGDGLSPTSMTYVADGEIKGPWVEMTAARVEDNYALPPWTRGIVAHWYRQDFRTTEGVTRVDNGPVEKMLERGKLGRAIVKGKDLAGADGKEQREFGYYSLRRCDKGRLSYRTWGNGQLVKDKSDKWMYVANEKFPDDDKASSYEGIRGGARSGNPPPSWEGEGQGKDAVAYSQTDYGVVLLKTWSK